MTNFVKEFEELVEELLVHMKFEVERPEASDLGYDLIAVENELKVAVELKFSYSPLISDNLLLTSAKHLAHKLKLGNRSIFIGILITSTFLSKSSKIAILNETGISIWDRNEVIANCRYNIELKNKFESLFNERMDYPYKDLIFSKSNISDEFNSILNLRKRKKSELEGESYTNKGEEICKELNSIDAGKKEWRQFELKIEEALKYIFSEDLSSWNSQLRTDDSLNRYDLLARIKSVNSYWTSLSRNFNSQYVLFDAKNYTKPMKPGQIYNTERYLFKSALRSIGFIIARNGYETNTLIAAKGALRESGKLIQILTLNDICELLKLRDANDDPNSIMSDMLDEYLMKLSR